MMLELKIEKTKSNPEVIYSEENNKLSIVGRSVLKNMDDYFYHPIFNFIEEYKKQGKEGLILELFLDYFNTSSHPSLIKIFKGVSEIPSSEIRWLYEESDIEMMEIGHELQKYSPQGFIIKKAEN